MSHTTAESDNRMISEDQSDSPSIDEGSCAGSFLGGGAGLKKGPWTSGEDAILIDYVKKHGEGNWNAVQKLSGLSRCGKSCRLRWANHLRPNLKKGAITPEEEQLIIELHSKMGNKWARMASRLHGRTDNEIKNYWNTRIKRRQRAGLPLYPSNMCLQPLEENHQCEGTSEYSAGDKQHNENLQPNNCVMPDVTFVDFKANQGTLSYALPFSDINVSSMLSQGLGSQYYAFTTPRINRVKRLQESETSFPRFHGSWGLPGQEQFQSDLSDRIHRPDGFGFPYDPDPGNKKMALFGGAFPGSHALLNGNLSTSHPHSGAEKLELPSLQYTGSDLNSHLAGPVPLDAYVESPPTTFVYMQAECVSPRNSGLLEDMLHGSQAKNQSSEKNSNTFDATPSDVMESAALNVCPTDWYGCNDPISPLGHSAASLFSESTPPTSVISLDECPPGNAITGLNIKPEPVERESTPNVGEEKTLLMELSRPDALVGSNWCNYNDSGMNHSSWTDSVLTMLGGDFL